MKTRFTVLARSVIAASLLWNTVALAEDCTSEDQATPKNVYSCKIDATTKMKLVAGWLVDPAIQKTSDFDSLVGGIGQFFDATILNPVLVKLVNQDDLPNDKKALVVMRADSIDGKLTPAMKTYIGKTALHFGCSKLGDAALEQYSHFGPKDADLAAAMNYAISYCDWDTANFTTATNIVGRGYPAGVLPLMDRLAKWKTDIDASPDTDCAGTSGRHWYEGFQNAIVSGLSSLGRIRAPRAQPLVNSFTGVRCQVMAKAARSASSQIDTGNNLRSIRQGDADGITWGMDMIQNHDGAYASVQNEILDAFAAVMKTKPSTQAKIKRFLREEYESGYHAGNADLNARLHKLSL